MLRILTLLFLFQFFIVSPIYPGGMRGPEKKNIPNSSIAPSSSNQNPIALHLISFFSRYISPADGPRSPSYPTGSAYGKNVLKKHGFFLGIILTADRLIHESDAPLGPIIFHHGKKRFYDPVESNTFWWNTKTKM